MACDLFCLSQIWVYGNSFESCLVAVVNPNKQAIERWAQQNDVSGDFNSLCENAKVKEYVLGELNKIAKDKKVSAFPRSRTLNCSHWSFSNNIM